MNYIKEYQDFILSSQVKQSEKTTLKYNLIGNGKEVILALLGNNLLGANAYFKTIEKLKENYSVLVFNHQNEYEFIEQIVDDLNQLIEELKIDKVHLLGISIGGVIAQYFAKKYPDKTKSLMVYQTFTHTNMMETDAIETKNEILEVINQLTELRKQIPLENIKMAQIYQIEEVLRQVNYAYIEDAIDLYTYMMIDYTEEDEKQLMLLLKNFLNGAPFSKEDFSYLDHKVLFIYDFEERAMGGQSMDNALLDILPNPKTVALDVEKFVLVLESNKLVEIVLEFLSEIK
ncbi:Putative hydrolase [Alteracholeplasma palmae J233]|uniref:Maspardin n=1 Tax=Alteracholeplasma palmae (strain ATCC 49389 / J233) TaxID=1318466 RepID=U4KM00_ALTPJ|nr:alpha/beta hydrolase [Alteracholeplasma palmae]CCV64968.1 Putative hydrolase [Alteracholeplasma palmae J233]